MNEYLLWLGAIITLLLIVVISVRIYCNMTDSPSPIYTKGLNVGHDYIMVIHGGVPQTVSREWFTSEIKNIKTDVVNIYARVSSASCKSLLLTNLMSLKDTIEQQTRNLGADKHFCSEVKQFLAGTGGSLAKYNEMKKEILQSSTKTLRALSKSDTNVDDGLEKAFEDVAANLDAILYVVLSNTCTAEGRLNLDYINDIVAKLGSMCDYNVQAGLIKPIVNTLVDNIIDPIMNIKSNPNYKVPPPFPSYKPTPTIAVTPIVSESFENGRYDVDDNFKMRRTAPGAGVKPKHVGSNLYEAEAFVRQPSRLPTPRDARTLSYLGDEREKDLNDIHKKTSRAAQQYRPAVSPLKLMASK